MSDMLCHTHGVLFLPVLRLQVPQACFPRKRRQQPISTAIRPFRFTASKEELVDLRRRNKRNEVA